MPELLFFAINIPAIWIAGLVGKSSQILRNKKRRYSQTALRPGLQTLTNHIRERLGTHKSCSVFETDLERVFPFDETRRKKRIAEIEAYAKRNGWSVRVWDPGLRVTFSKPRLTADHCTSRATSRGSLSSRKP